jgi:RHH-type transcriptional regulator, rel operon repressor / antitoxin RelB
MAISIQLPDDVEVRLQNLAMLTGRSKAFYITKAVLEQLDDIENLYLVEQELESLRDGISPPPARHHYDALVCP